MERRRYFRIDDEIGLRYRLLTLEEVVDFNEGRLPIEDSETAILDRQITVLLEAVRIQSPEVCELIDLLNQKISLLGGAQPSSNVPAMSPPVGVNLSACGVAFECTSMMQSGEVLLLDIMLNGSRIHFPVLGRIVASDKVVASNGGQVYLTRVDFEQVDDASQELLVQHVVRQQGRLLKARRESRLQQQ